MLTNMLRNQMTRLYRGRARQDREELQRKMHDFQTGPFSWALDLPSSLLFGRSLKMLASIYMTDKWNKHWYAQHYEVLLNARRRQRLNVLEIGIGGYDDPRGGGNSLRMWRAYFPKARIFGIDIHDKSFHDERRIKTFKGSQADPEFLNRVMNEMGKVDIIIDDGSHISEHAIFTFRHLFPRLADGGLYFVEDTQTSYWADWGGDETERNNPATTMGFFKSLVDGLNWVEYRGEYSPTYLDTNIQSISFFHNLIAIRKGPNREESYRP